MNIFKRVLLIILFSSTSVALMVKLIYTRPSLYTAEFYPLTQHHPEWEIVPSQEQLSQTMLALHQSYSYLGEGSQCYAFESQDGQFVLKIFKAKHQRHKNYKKAFASLFNSSAKNLQIENQKQEKWRKKFFAACNSYKIAFEEFSEETGTFFLHFNQTHELLPMLTLRDQKGKSCLVNLNDIPFFLQKKADLLLPRLKELIIKKDYTRIRSIIDSIDKLLVRKASKGITDPNQCYSINYGLIHDQAIQFDAGKIVKNSSIAEAPDEEIQRVRGKLNRWLAKHFPELTDLSKN